MMAMLATFAYVRVLILWSYWLFSKVAKVANISTGVKVAIFELPAVGGSAYERRAAMKWQHHPNLRRRPHAPNKGRGRLQRAIARALLAAGSDTLSSTAVYDWCFARDRHRPLGVAPLFRLADPAGGRDAGGCSRCAPRIAIFSSCY